MARENKKELSGAEQKRLLIEAVHSQDLGHKALLRVIIRLCNSLEKGVILEAFETGLGKSPEPRDDCVLFDDLALRFTVNGRLADIFRVIEGTTTPANIVIRSESDGGGNKQ